MAFDPDDEILQDFLVEAGEIIDSLGAQLVELEQAPNDYELLNSIFRGFHTVKGGAGFLSIDPLVEICHKAEDVFNILRQGERKTTPELMDVVLQALDALQDMFASVNAGQMPAPADPSLLARLKKFTVSDVSSPSEASAPEPGGDAQPAPGATGLDAVEQAFEGMLVDSGLDDEPAAQEVPSEADLDAVLGGRFDDVDQGGQAPTDQEGGDEITEQEFEALLDQLHGPGRFGAAVAGSEDSSDVSANTASESSAAGDEITEEEFEQLLDNLHGKGQFQGAPAASENEPPSDTTPAAEAGDSKPVPTPPPPPTPAKPRVEAAPHAEGAAKAKPVAEATVRVDTQILDEIMNLVGELVLVRNRLQTLRLTSGSDEDMVKAIANLDIVTGDLQVSVMKTRMQPIKKVFGRFPRLVRDLARNLNKEIDLQLIGEETDLDKNLVEALADPLIHLVRNAVDHGIESPEQREAAGKPRQGKVVLSASQEGDHIQLSIQDDGGGIDPEVIRAKVVDKGLMDQDTAARLEAEECFNLIFMPGFSTKAEISDVSGRGVGMDVVKTRIAQMNGSVKIQSKLGEGSKFIIQVPLTLAIMPTLMVKLNNQSFALPLASVMEILDLDLRRTNVVDGRRVIMVRDKALPIFFLGEWLIHDPCYQVDKSGLGHVVVVNASGRAVGLVVDRLVGQEEVVIKALGAKLHGLDGLAGATITGDGRIALILDVPGLMKKYAA
ncbi:MAG: chemotaxis protein CheA [Methylococcales bacterium]|nr:chemotaxis protein CheA [Methylococcales bacterium]